MGNPGFLSELRRRHVWRVAVAYAVVGWALIEISSTIIPALHLPESLTTAIVVLVLLGFPVAVVLAWAFEMTPEGVRRTEPVHSPAARAPEQHRHIGRKLDFIIIAVLVVAVAGLAWRQFVPHGTVPGNTAAASVPDKSIAVLPFDNLSADKDNAYFADGIQDEILTSLARIGQLKVISRTSTKGYGSRPDNLTRIAAELGVATILEGSVQRVGKRVRVNVQLINAASDSHMWAETYDRDLDDVFAVQSEIAQRIAGSLRATLTRDERATLTTRPTSNPEAYKAYLRGRALNARGSDSDVARQATAGFAEAVRLDPEFALAWAELAQQASYLYFNGVDPAVYTADYVKHATDEAMRLKPDALESQVALGTYRYRVLRDLPAAAQALQAALEKSPNNPVVLATLGYVERRQGKWEQAVAHLEKASALDPRNAGYMVVIGGETLKIMRRYDQAMVWIDRALALTPDSVGALAYKAQLYWLQGQLEEALRVLEPLPVAGEDPGVAQMRSNILLSRRQYEAVIEELTPVLAQPDAALNGWGPQLLVNLGDAQRLAGKLADARATYERLVRQVQPNADKMDDTIQPIVLAAAYAGLGRNGEALDQAQRAVELYRGDAIYRPTAALMQAQVQAVAGDRQAAISALGHLLRQPGGATRALLRLDPAWDPLRKEPGFQALLKPDVAAGGSSE